MNDLKRRQFLNMLASAGAVTTFGGATSIIPSQAHAATFNDYKAMVVLFLHGGNDSFNMLLPLTSESGTTYETYKTSRGDMAINKLTLDPFTRNPYYDANSIDTSDKASYKRGVYDFGAVGVNGMMPELAQLINAQKASFVANIGTLVEPVTKEDIKDKTKRLPPFLYAHNHQQRAMETGWADNLSAGGWAGRLADMWGIHQNQVNGGSPLGLNVSYGGATRLMTASYNSPVVLSPGNDNQIFPDNGAGGFYQSLFDDFNRPSATDSPLSRVLKAANRRASSLADVLGDINKDRFVDESNPEAPEDPRLQNAYGKPLFSTPTPDDTQLVGSLRGSLLRAAKSAALMIDLGIKKQISRQIIFIEMGGFDNHSGLLTQHPLLLREISLVMADFQKAMEYLDLGDKVTLFTLSDFGRTLGNNGDGTDHAWAGNNIAVGGGLNGRAMIGQFPDMTLGGPSDTGTKGRMIPTIAVDQYLATICSWFGVDDGEIAELFPNLHNFESTSGDIRSAYLSGMFKSTGGILGTDIKILDLPEVKLPI